MAAARRDGNAWIVNNAIITKVVQGSEATIFRCDAGPADGFKTDNPRLAAAGILAHAMRCDNVTLIGRYTEAGTSDLLEIHLS